MSRLCDQLRKIKDLTFRNRPDTEYHRQAWEKFDKVLIYRANTVMLGKILFHWIVELQGNVNHMMSERDVEDGKVPNADFARLVFPYARFSVYLWGFNNILLLILSFKWPSVTKLYFYQMFLISINEFFLPFEMPESQDTKMCSMVLVIDFFGTYFHWWPSLILSML